MVDIVEQRETVDREATPQAGSKIPIRVKLGLAEEREIELDQGASVCRILEIVAAERGCSAEELVLVREAEDEPLTVGVVVDAEYACGRPHHVHCPDEVEVRVYYQDSHDSREFRRFETLRDVLGWAIAAFGIDEDLATELVLVRHGEKDELSEREHIGHLAGRNSDLALDLVRGVIPNGSCS